DSKKLSPEKREALAPEIEKVSQFEVVVIPAEQIDVMRAEMSLNDFEAKLFAEVIAKLRPETAYVDAADVDEIEFKRSVRRELARRTPGRPGRPRGGCSRSPRSGNSMTSGRESNEGTHRRGYSEVQREGGFRSCAPSRVRRPPEDRPH